jgi:hypothetical protein
VVTKKAATTAKDAIVKDPATFDVVGWLDGLSAQGFKPRNVRVKMHLRGDLLPRIKYLVEQIQANDGDDDREFGVDDVDPLDEIRDEYERLVEDLREGGALEFVFRPINKRINDTTLEAWRAKYPDSGEKPTDPQIEDLIVMRMAASCVDYPGSNGAPLPPEALFAFEDMYGTPAFKTLMDGFNEAYMSGGEVDAPFLQRRSRSRGTGG